MCPPADRLLASRYTLHSKLETNMAEEGGFPAHPPSIFKMAFSSEGKSALKERFRKGKITDYSLDLFSPHNGKSPAERLRDLDYIRMHTPYEDEVAILNVTPYRMDILSSQEVMYLCGGLVGVRFSSEDLMTILKTTKKMTSVWEELSVLFNNMPTGTKKAVLRDDAEDSETTRALRAFHERADEYVAQFGELQSLIREKQKLIDPSLRLDMPKLDADPESRMGRKLPDWLSTLIEKHQRSKAGGEGAAAVRSSQLRVGELSVYLSSCIAGLVQTNEAETEAIAILVQASNDTVMSVSDADIHAVTDHDALHGGHHAHRGRCGSPTLFTEGAAPKSRKYWARRFYNFLSKMTELASAIKDEATVDNL